jgi:hypothetical protein
MAKVGDSTLGFLLTLLTIQRSRIYRSTNYNYLVSYILRRILMAGIRNRGQCPCPRCKTPLSASHLVGTKQDRKNRLRLQRIDDSDRRDAVARARFEIYNRNQHVNGARVERCLKEHSLVPTAVR